MSTGIQLLSLEPHKDIPTEIQRRREIVTHTHAHSAKVALMQLLRNHYDRYDQFSYYIGVTVNPISRRSGHKRKAFSLSIDHHPDQAIHFSEHDHVCGDSIHKLKNAAIKLQFKGHYLWDKMCIFYETHHLADIRQFESDAIAHLLVINHLAYPDATNANAIDSGYAKKASTYYAYVLLGNRFERQNGYIDKQRKLINHLSQTNSSIALREALTRKIMVSDKKKDFIRLIEEMVEDKDMPMGSRQNLSLALQSILSQH